jgi:gamma-glutamylcyclotransferase
MSLVFAYGSNLNREQMLARCPSSRIVVAATLHGAALTFAGFSVRWGGPVATFIGRRKATLPGLLYRVDPIDLWRLDGYEGAPHTYARVLVNVISAETRREAPAIAYKLTSDWNMGELPSMDYLCTIDRAYRDLGFDRGHLFRAAFRQRARSD